MNDRARSQYMVEKYGSAYTDALDSIPSLGGEHVTLNTKKFAQNLLEGNFSKDKILAQYGLRGYSFTGKFTEKEGVPNEAMFSTSESLKLLNDSLDDASKALDEAKKKLADLFDPFATAFEQLMGRAKELLQKEFELEQQQLNAEMEDALYNVDALYNGETMRLGVLQEQYAITDCP